MTATSIDRAEELQKLDDFIENSKNRLTSILSRLGWSVESVSKDVEKLVVCPFNASHRVPERSLDKHLHDCQWKAEGYGKHDLPLSVPSLHPGAPSSIKFDEQLQEEVIRKAKEQNPTMAVDHCHCYTMNGLDEKWYGNKEGERKNQTSKLYTIFVIFSGVGGRLIPRTSDRLTADFTREERCAMYEYVIANTVEPDIGDDIADMNKPTSSLGHGKTSSYLELLAQERNLKRRRAKYRGVHTNKKSQVEILREVVNQQMEMLTEYIAEKRNEASDNPANSICVKSLEKCHNESWRSDRIVADKSISSSNAEDVHHRSNCSKGVEVLTVHERTSDNRRYDRRNDGSRRDFHGRGERSAETRKSSSCRRDSSERKSHKSSHHKKHRHKSKDRHKRSRSQEREKARSSRDKREYDDRVNETDRRSHSDNRRRKKPRSRSR